MGRKNRNKNKKANKNLKGKEKAESQNEPALPQQNEEPDVDEIKTIEDNLVINESVIERSKLFATSDESKINEQTKRDDKTEKKSETDKVVESEKGGKTRTDDPGKDGEAKKDKKIDEYCSIINDNEVNFKLSIYLYLRLKNCGVDTYEEYLKIEKNLLSSSETSIKDFPDTNMTVEYKLNLMKYLCKLHKGISKEIQYKFLKEEKHLLLTVVDIAVHCAKNEKLNELRLTALECLMLHTATHSSYLNDDQQYKDPALEEVAMTTLSEILPGLLSMLYDVATCDAEHMIVVTAIEAIHRIIYLVVNNKYVEGEKAEPTLEDFAQLVREKTANQNNQQQQPTGNLNSVEVRSPQWFQIIKGKLNNLVTNLNYLVYHDHPKVRKEMAVFASRLTFECSRVLDTSQQTLWDILLPLICDDDPEISNYTLKEIQKYIQSIPAHEITTRITAQLAPARLL